jgi:hypothetical protein
MFITKTKKAKTIDMDSKLKEYVIKNYDNESLTDKVKNYFADLTQNRNVISQMAEVQESIEQLKQNINIITTYLNQLMAIKQKMTFGKESYSCSIEFTWNDTIKGSTWHSYNIWFEVYNMIFNLAVSYYCLGKSVGKAATDKMGHKEASKYFKNAMYLFNVIKEEAITKIQEKELPYDLFPPHMDYCITLCEIQGQLEIYKIAKETSPNEFSLHSKLLLTVSLLFAKAKSLCQNQYTKKGTSDNLIQFLENRIHYYKALMCRDLRDGSKKNFDQTGLKYGDILFYQGLYVRSLLECQKNIKKCGKLVNVEEFEKQLEEEQKAGEQMLDLNTRIYHHLVPKEDELVFDQKNMMSMALPEDLYIRENAEKAKKDDKIHCQDLDLLVNKEVKNMINGYKTKMNEFIGKNLDQYENEGTIKNFVQNLFLPKKLTQRPDEVNENEPPSEFPPQLWEKIERVQQIGGTMALNRIMNGIMNKTSYLIGQCENLLQSLEAEDRDDTNMRQRFGNKWIREPSQKLNFKLVQGAQQYIANLNKTKQFDQKENNEIMENARYFEQLSLPRDQLVNNIPRREELKEKEIPEEKEVRAEILKLYELGDKCMNVIKPIFNELNDDSVIVGQFIEVLNKKTTEQAIYEKFKEEYEAKFKDLKTISDQIKQQEEVVNNVVQKNSAKIREKPQPNINNEAMNYFRMLDQYANMFMTKYEKLMKGDKYYNGLYEKITNLCKLGNDWMIKRSDEKNAILSTISGSSAYRSGNQGGNYLTASALMDPERNPFTKMNVANINQQGNFGRPMGGNQGGQGGNHGNFNNNNQGFGGNQGNFNNQGGFGGNQGGFGGNRGGY